MEFPNILVSMYVNVDDVCVNEEINPSKMARGGSREKVLKDVLGSSEVVCDYTRYILF